MDKIIKYKKNRKKSIITFVLGIISLGITYFSIVGPYFRCIDVPGGPHASCAAHPVTMVFFGLGVILILTGFIGFIIYQIKLFKSKK